MCLAPAHQKVVSSGFERLLTAWARAGRFMRMTWSCLAVEAEPRAKQFFRDVRVVGLDRDDSIHAFAQGRQSVYWIARVQSEPGKSY